MGQVAFPPSTQLPRWPLAPALSPEYRGEGVRIGHAPITRFRTFICDAARSSTYAIAFFTFACAAA